MKSKSLFDHIDAIYTNKTPEYYRELSDADKKSFNGYMITRGISMNLNFVNIANIPNFYWGQLQSEQLYRFYSDMLPRGKQYNKWVKSNKVASYDEWVIELIAKYYECSHADAVENIHVLITTQNGRDTIIQILEAFGTEPKKIAKLKL